jgi:hypothetical protein
MACAASIGMAAAPRTATTWNVGDVFAAVGSGQYNVYDNNGVFKEAFLDGNLIGFTAGSAFNPSFTRLYTTNFSFTTVWVFDVADPHNIVQFIDTNAFTFDFGNPDLFWDGNCESITFLQNGSFLVGHQEGSFDVVHFDASGNHLSNFDVARDSSGSDWIEISNDQKTLFYTSEGRRVLRYDVSTDTQLADFATLSGSGRAHGLRLLSPGDGTGGLLVADEVDIKRLNGSGGLVQTYDVAGDDGWFSLALDPNGTSFWAGSSISGNFYRFDLASGSVEVGPIPSGSVAFFGLTVKGEQRAGTPQGCSPGFWKNHPEAWPQTGHSIFDTVGGVGFVNADPSLSVKTLLEALSFKGGSGVLGAQQILLRAGSAALLNASHPSIFYPMTSAQVLQDVNSAISTGNRQVMLDLAKKLDAFNNLGCPKMDGG